MKIEEQQEINEKLEKRIKELEEQKERQDEIKQKQEEELEKQRNTPNENMLNDQLRALDSKNFELSEEFDIKESDIHQVIGYLIKTESNIENLLI